VLTFYPAGDNAIIIKAGDEISVALNNIIRSLLATLESEKISGVTEFVPSYNELLICYNPKIIGYEVLLGKIKNLNLSADTLQLPPTVVIEVPVLYNGPDLEEVASVNKLSVNEVIEIHSSVEYLVYMLGFTPGFCYLGGMDSRIATPRKESPRLKIPAGSVGIAGGQTGIYPIESPGGWQLIGETPYILFDPSRKNFTGTLSFLNEVAGRRAEFLFHMGDRLRFKPVEKEEYSMILDSMTTNR